MNTNKLILSRFFSTLAFQIIGLYGFFKVFKITNSPLLTGIVGLFLYLPSLFLSLYAGQKTNNVKKIGLVYFILVVAQIAPLGLLFFSNEFAPYINYIAVGLLSILRSFRSPFYYRVIKEAKESSSSLARLNSLSWQLPLVIAPLIFLVMDSLQAPVEASLITGALALLVAGFLLKGIIQLENSEISTKEKIALNISKLNLRENYEKYFPFVADIFLTLFLGLNVFFGFLVLQKGISSVEYPLLKMIFHIGSVVVVTLLHMRKTEVSYKSVLILWIPSLIGIYFAKNLIGILLFILFLGALDGVSSIVRDKILISHDRSLIGIASGINSILISLSDELGEFITGSFIQYIKIEGLLVLNILISLLLLSIYLFIEKAGRKNNMTFNIKRREI